MKAARFLCMALALASLAYSQDKKDDPSQIGNRDVGKGLNFYSLEKEMALGKQLAREVRRQAKIVDDGIVSEYINRLGQKLVRNSDAKVPFTFQVIDNEIPNAFSLPGGYVFVNTGLIELAEEEDELAGAMAHEIAHVAARHMTREATKSQIIAFAAMPLSFFLGGWVGLTAQPAAGLVAPMALLNFSRADEAEADYLGVQYMYAAGYDPTGVISIFEKLDALARRNPGAMSRRLLATHPSDSERIQKTEKEIERILPPRARYIVNTSEYHDMRERVFRMEAQAKPEGQEKPPSLLQPRDSGPRQ